MACAVEHHAAIGEAGSVGDGDGGQLDLTHVGLQTLAQGLNGIEDTGRRLSAHHHALAVHLNGIAFGLQDFLIQSELDVTFGIDDIKLNAGILLHVVAQEFCIALQGLIFRVTGNGYMIGQNKGITFLLYYVLRKRYYSVIRHFRLGESANSQHR